MPTISTLAHLYIYNIHTYIQEDERGNVLVEEAAGVLYSVQCAESRSRGNGSTVQTAGV